MSHLFDRLPAWLRHHIAGLRILLVLSVIFGVGYPLAVTGIAQLPGLRHHADGSILTVDGRPVGSALIGQSFTRSDGKPMAADFQSRPSAGGYNPLASGASNLGPEDIVDMLPNPRVNGDTGTQSLLTQVCARSRQVGRFNGVDGQRPYCTAGGVGAVLSVIHSDGVTGRVVKVVSVNQECPASPFIANFDGVRVQCAAYDGNYSNGQIVPVRGPGKAWPANPVPPDAVTASGSGLDPDISTAYAELQAPRVASARGLSLNQVTALITRYTTRPFLGFIGQAGVNVLELNLALDRLPERTG